MPRRLGNLDPVYLPRLTLFGRSALLLAAELLANVVCWIATAILFGRKPETQPILSLALLAWTIGLRHALDADHISAIDNATRSLINMGQLPVTCGLFFSLGHSTIVIVVNVAIAISTDVYDRMQGVGEVGGIDFAETPSERSTREDATAGDDPEDDDDGSHQNTIMMKLIGPVVTFVDRPWKMYPVGVLFGFGFDTASSIALLAISAIAKRDPNGGQINPADVIVLPLLFTVGMTLIDSLDSIIMLYSYAGFPERTFAIFERPNATRGSSARSSDSSQAALEPNAASSAGVDLEARSEPASDPATKTTSKAKSAGAVVVTAGEDGDDAPEYRTTLHVKRNAMSNLSIVLTTMSIVVAFSISLITIMGLIGEQCTPCQDAANAPDGGGLAGRWWRGWANANDNSGYIGAAIVASFVFVVSSWYGGRFLYRKWHTRGDRTAARVE
ncbi:hypothetical protein V8D89_012703 [Ganoderma adspersum]